MIATPTKPNTDTAALATNILASLGIPARENFTIHAADDAFAHGRVLAFNASQFAGSAPHEFLTNYAVRYQDPGAQGGVDALRRFIAPDVPANNSQFVEYALYNFADAYAALDNPNDDLRAIGADFPTLRSPNHQLVSQRVANRGIALEVDEDEERLDSDWQERKIAFLRGVLDRSRLRRTIALFVAGAVSVTKTWDGTSDPDQDVIDELEAQSLRASRIVYGPGAWTKRSRAFRVQNTAGSHASAKMTLEDLAGEFAVEEVQVARSKYTTGTTSASNIVGSQVLLFVAGDNLGRIDFSNLKTFTAPTRTGARYAVYVRQVGDKRWRIALECYETVAITSTVGLEVITVN